MAVSVLMSVYHKEKSEQLSLALESVINQTYRPKEIVLVKDGPLDEALELTIESFVQRYPDLMKIVALKENRGLGFALSIGLKNCSYEWVARMDSDDIALPARFEKQFQFLTKNKTVDILGTNIEEFDRVPGDLKRYKVNPETHEALIKNIQFRSPFNHPTIMFRKEAVLAAGNYSGEILLFEDYTLFLRMMKAGCRFHNLQEVLLYFRIGDGLQTIKRRSGLHYAKKELKFVSYALSIKAFSFLQAATYVITKIPIRLLPPKMVLFLYNSFLRKRNI